MSPGTGRGKGKRRTSAREKGKLRPASGRARNKAKRSAREISERVKEAKSDALKRQEEANEMRAEQQDVLTDSKNVTTLGEVLVGMRSSHTPFSTS
eukprot:gene42662-41044_t